VWVCLEGVCGVCREVSMGVSVCARGGYVGVPQYVYLCVSENVHV
jgi:hypothetical protein